MPVRCIYETIQHVGWVISIFARLFIITTTTTTIRVMGFYRRPGSRGSESG